MLSRRVIPVFSCVPILAALLFALLAACAPCSDEGCEYPELRGPYLGQEPPGASPRLFAPGFVNTGLYTRDVAMTPDGKEFYFGVSTGGFHVATIAFTKLVDGVWTPPEIVPFGRDARYMNAEPFITPDGQRLLFLSNRPKPGQSDEEATQDIWAVDRVGDGWGEAYNFGEPVNSAGEEFYPSMTVDGTVYFTRSPEGTRENHVYRSRLVDGVYQEPEKLGAPLNQAPNFNAFIAPDERYLIVPTMRDDSLGGVDYYISFRDEDDTFGELINMGPSVNSEVRAEWSAYLSPDGEYLFFMSGARDGKPSAEEDLTWCGLQELHNSPHNGGAKIYWVDASFIDDLRPQD